MKGTVPDVSIVLNANQLCAVTCGHVLFLARLRCIDVVWDTYD